MISTHSISQDELAPLSGPLSSTHDTRRADYHMKDLEAFAKDLQNVSLPKTQGRAGVEWLTINRLLIGRSRMRGE